MSYNSNKSFESDKTWEIYDNKGQAEELRLPAVLDAIPSGVNTIIDIGCGNGLITNQLDDRYNVTGVDISEAALKNVKTKKICSSCTEINLPDQSFDLVLSNELLEHLDDRDLLLAVSEMVRLSKKYIIITVPFNENLNQSAVKCPECGQLYHVVGHLRSFTGPMLATLFDKHFKVIDKKTFGRKTIRYNNSLLKIRQKFSNQYYNPVGPTICPHCNNTEFEKPKGTLLSKTCNGINRIIGKRQPYWLMMLFEKE